MAALARPTTRAHAEQAKKAAAPICAICLEPLTEFAAEQKVVLEVCQHEFCKQCIFQALTLRPTCPLCRAVVDIEVYGLRAASPEAEEEEAEDDRSADDENSDTSLSGFIVRDDDEQEDPDAEWRPK